MVLFQKHLSSNSSSKDAGNTRSIVRKNDLMTCQHPRHTRPIMQLAAVFKSNHSCNSLVFVAAEDLCS